MMTTTPVRNSIDTEPPPVIRNHIYAQSNGKYPRPINLHNMIDINKLYATQSGTLVMVIKRIDDVKAVCFISNNLSLSKADIMSMAPIDVTYDQNGLNYVNLNGDWCRIEYSDCLLKREQV